MLVLGAAGGVGHLAVQIAKARGAWVAGTSSVEKHDFLRGLGVDEPLDKSGELAVEVDAVLDAVGGDAGLAAVPALRDGGTLVTLSTSAVPALQEAAAGRVRVAGILVEPDRARPGGPGGDRAEARTSTRRSRSRKRRAPTSSASRAAPVGRSS